MVENNLVIFGISSDIQQNGVTCYAEVLLAR